VREAQLRSGENAAGLVKRPFEHAASPDSSASENIPARSEERVLAQVKAPSSMPTACEATGEKEKSGNPALRAGSRVARANCERGFE